MSTELLTRDRLAEQTGGVWDYVSPSRLSLWLKCPLAFKLRYLDGIQSPTSPSMFIGRICHVALEGYYRHRQLGITLESADVLQRLVESWGEAAADEAVTFKSTADEAVRCNQAIDLITAYFAQIPADEPKPLAVEAALEAPLVDPVTGENFGIPLVGVMDLVLPESDGPLIADFKTTSRGGAPLEIAHEIQLTSYSYLFRHAAQEVESALEIRSLVKSKTAKIETHRYSARTDRHYRRLFSVIRAYLDDLDVGRFIYRPGLSCGMCEFRNSLCRAWGD